MNVSVVLVNPQIPQNTGNIARLTAANYVRLHLIEPLGFELDEKRVRRAGLDYWPETDIELHKNWEAFLEKYPEAHENVWLFTTKSAKPIYDVQFGESPFLVFGNETAGVSEGFHQMYPERRVRIPMENPNIRSLNLSNSVSIGLFEALRQQKL